LEARTQDKKEGKKNCKPGLKLSYVLDTIRSAAPVTTVDAAPRLIMFVKKKKNPFFFSLVL